MFDFLKLKTANVKDYFEELITACHMALNVPHVHPVTSLVMGVMVETNLTNV